MNIRLSWLVNVDVPFALQVFQALKFQNCKLLLKLLPYNLPMCCWKLLLL